jgi:hypothetical protein
MSGGGVRAALAAFDDGALEALANKGLVRRAQKDIEAGKVAITAESAAGITVAADGETVKITAHGPREARCSCPAAGVCRHKIAAVLIARCAFDAAPMRDPLQEALAIETCAIVKWAGKPAIRAAAERLAVGVAAQMRVEGSALIIQLAPTEPEVRFHAGQGLDGIISKAPRTRRPALHALALLAARRAHGVTENPPIEMFAPASASERPDEAFLDQVRKALFDAAFTMLNQAPLVLEERLFALASSSRADALPRLGRELRELAVAMRQKRSRDFTFSPSEALARLAGTNALVDALSRPQAPERLAFLKGTARQDYRPAGTLTLFGLGARLWRGQIGARGLTGYFYAAEPQRIVTASLARASAHDRTFDATSAYGGEGLWSAGPLRELVRSQVRLSGAALSPEGRLSLGAASRGQRTARLPDRDLCASWPCAFANWHALQSALQAHFDLRLAGSADMPHPVLLVPALHAEATFNAITQEWIWGLADENGSWMGLSLTEKDRDAMALARMRRISELGDVIVILAEARPAGPSFTLEPIAAVALMPSSDHLEFLNLDLETHGTALPSAAMRADWLARLRRKPMGAPPVPVALTAVSGRAPTARLADEAFEVMLGRAELGTLRATPQFRGQAAHFARTAETMGLLPLADTLTAAMRDADASNPAALLRAAHIIGRIRASTRQLPWLAERRDTI